MPVGVGEDSVQGLPGGVHKALPAHQQLRSLWSTMEKRACSPLNDLARGYNGSWCG